MTKGEKTRRHFKRERSEIWLATCNGWSAALGLILLDHPDWGGRIVGAVMVATAVIMQRGIFAVRKKREQGVMKVLEKSGEANRE